jgi:hypothetical protein
MTDIQKLISKFTSDLETAVAMKAGEMVLAAFDPKGRNAPKPVHETARRKSPVQLCPVPGCKGRAAPSLHMVCSKHRNVPKAKIKAYREARKAAKKAA